MSPAVREGLRAAAQWVGVEFGVRWLGWGILVGILALSFSMPLLSGTTFTISLVALIVAMLLLGLLFRRRIKRESLGWRTLGYARLTGPIVIAGLAAGALDLAFVILVTGPLDQFLFPEGVKTAAALLRMLKEGGLLAAVLLLPGNGVLGPLIEEYAWRGYIQTRLMEGLGVRNGLAATALLFAAKHMVVDFSASRLTSLLATSFVLGFVRLRWGTTASTITHVVGNLVATSLAIVEAFSLSV